MKTYKTLFFEGHKLDKYSSDLGMQKYFDKAKPKKRKCDAIFAEIEVDLNRKIGWIIEKFEEKPMSHPLKIEDGMDLVGFSSKMGGFVVNLDNLRYNERLWYGWNMGKEAKHPSEGWEMACKKFASRDIIDEIDMFLSGKDLDPPDEEKKLKAMRKEWKMMCESAFDDGPFFVPGNKFKQLVRTK